MSIAILNIIKAYAITKLQLKKCVLKNFPGTDNKRAISSRFCILKMFNKQKGSEKLRAFIKIFKRKLTL